MSIQSHSQKPTFDHLAIYVVDLKKSAAFYQDIIGLDTIRNPFQDDKHIWFNIGGSNELHVIAGATSMGVHPRENHFCFSVASLEMFIQTLTKANISFQNARGETKKITLRPDGVQQVYFTDPDGHWIEMNDGKKK